MARESAYVEPSVPQRRLTTQSCAIVLAHVAKSSTCQQVQSPVQLNQHADVVVGAVGDVLADPPLPGCLRQPMASLHVTDVTDLQQRLRSRQVRRERLAKICTPTNPTCAQRVTDLRRDDGIGLTGVGDEGQRVVELVTVRELVQDRVSRGHPWRRDTHKPTILRVTDPIQAQPWLSADSPMGGYQDVRLGSPIGSRQPEMQTCGRMAPHRSLAAIEQSAKVACQLWRVAPRSEVNAGKQDRPVAPAHTAADLGLAPTSHQPLLPAEHVGLVVDELVQRKGQEVVEPPGSA